MTDLVEVNTESNVIVTELAGLDLLEVTDESAVGFVDQQIDIIEVVEQGPQTAPGQGVPIGGTIGQHLAKIDSTDFNTEWVDPIDISGKQDTLISGTNIKTINSTSLLGSGNIAISAGSSLIIDTKRNILTSTPADPSVALASDTNEYYAYDGTNWNKASLPLSETSANPDIGPMRNNDKLGYNDNSITDNNIANLVLEGSSRTEDGGLRIDHSSSPVKAQIYYDEAWHEFIAFDALPALTHTQKNTQMYATIGNSLLTDASGNPLVQQYAMSIGPLAAKLELDGGTF